jgi:uncharacterized protein involved in exopolysaccharide biosynthesis
MHPPTADGNPDRAGADDAATLLAIGATVIARWKLILLLACLGAAVTAVWSLVATPRYRSTLKFALDEQSATPSLGGLAALAGQFRLGTGGPRSLEFYAEVLTGRDLLERLAVDSFLSPEAPGLRRPLLTILGFGDGDSARALADAYDHLLDEVVATSINTQTGTITLDVSLPDPDLAAQVASRMFDRLGQFNVETRRSAATERRRFTERELARARQELTTAEAALRDFLEANRGGLESPRLAVRRQQIQRRVTALEEVFRELSRETQTARIDEVRDTPVFTLVQAPDAPIYREYPLRMRMTLVGGLLGGTLAIVWIAFATSLAGARSLTRRAWTESRSAMSTQAR